MDEIVGIALLDERCTPAQLHIRCQRPGKRDHYDSIPVYTKDQPKPCEQAWCYEIQGDTLVVTPSVHIRYQLLPSEEWHTLFHNPYNWTVKFQRAQSAEPTIEVRIVNGAYPA